MKNATSTETAKPFDLLGTWTAAKEKAEADVAELKDLHPPEVVRSLFEALTVKYFWEMRK